MFELSHANLRRLGLLLLLGLLLPATARPDEGPDRLSLTNFDQRIRTVAKPKHFSPARALAEARLRNALPSVSIDYDPFTGSPKWIQAGGRRLDSNTSAKSLSQNPEGIVHGFLQEHQDVFRHGPEVLAGAVKKRDYVGRDGVRTLVWEQTLDGIPVFESVFMAHTSAEGGLINLSSQFVPEPAKAAARGQGPAKSLRPKLTARAALEIAATNLGETILTVTADGPPGTGSSRQKFKLHPLPSFGEASLVWLPLDGDTLRLAWDVELTRREFKERFRLLIDATDGRIWLRRKLTVEVSEVLYRVFTSDSPSPLSPGLAVPTNFQPPLVERELLAISNLNAVASPVGWLNDGVLETRGNNVDARTDRDGDDRADLPRIQGTTNLAGQRVFDFPLNLGQHPTNYTAASLVQLFYWCNWMHDRLYDLGFDEQSGNFQKDNFGRGGLGSDAMVVDAQDGSGFNNANYTPTRDGVPGRIQMFLFNATNPNRDGSLDAEVVLHEYAHGLTDRLIGGGIGLSQLQSLGMGEGWSDFYALALLAAPEDDPEANYAMSGYVTYLFNGLTQNYYYGIRRYPYTPDLGVNPLTFKDIDPNQASQHAGVPRNPIITSTGAEVHRQGEVWCAMLWDMRALLLKKHAATNSASYRQIHEQIMRYVTQGLRYSPPNPTFVQARDAILFAARGSSDTNEIWQAFARRGLGRSAIASDSATTFEVVEAFDAPGAAQPNTFSVQFDSAKFFTGIAGGGFSPSAITNLLLNTSTNPVPWAAAVTVPWLQLSQSNGVVGPNAIVTNFLTTSSLASSLSTGLYQGTLYFTNLSATQTYAATYQLVVIPADGEPLTVLPTSTFNAQGPPGGPFNPPSRNYQISNSAGTNALTWRAFTSNNWLSLDFDQGQLPPPPSLTNLLVQLNTNALALPAGTHQGAIVFENVLSGARLLRPVTLRVGAKDHLTEDFGLAPFDLAFSTITFTPDQSESFYRMCREPAMQFPTDPTNGTVVTLRDDQYIQVALTNGQLVSLFGQSSNTIWIGANGNLSFDPARGNPARTDFFIAGQAAFFDVTRAAPIYGDLNPEIGGTISYQQLPNRFVVTYDRVPEFILPGQTPPSNENSFQIEMFYDGAIRFTWLHMDYADLQGAHVLVGLSRGEGIPADFVETDLSEIGPCVPVPSLLVPRFIGEGDGSQQGYVLLSAPSTNDLVVTLTSSDTNEVVLPPSVVLRAGQTSVAFGISAIDDGVPDGSQRVTLTAAIPDQPAASASLTVDDAETASLTLNVVARGQEGQLLPGAGVVTLDFTASKPVTIELLSHNAQRVQVPATVTVPAGASSANFDLALVNNALLDGAETVVIEASVANWSDDFDAIRVSDDESTALALQLPAEVNEGTTTLPNAGRLRLAGLAVSNIVIALQSEQPALLEVPALITNRAGTDNVRFDLTVRDNSVTNGVDFVHIRASAPGFITATGSVTFVDDERPLVPLDPFPADFASPAARDTAFKWNAGAHAPPGTQYRFYLGTNANLALCCPVLTTNTNVVRLSLQFEPKTTYFWKVVAVLPPFPDVEGPVWRFTTADFGYTFETIPSPQQIGLPFPVRVHARDELGLDVTNHLGSLSLSNYAETPSDSTIVISEIDPSGIARVEFMNVSRQDVDIAGWQVAVYDALRWPEPAVIFTIPGPSVARTGEVFLLRTSGPQFSPGRYPSFASGTNFVWSYNTVNNPIAVLLRNAAGQVVDFACAVDADPAQITTPISVPAAHWTSLPIEPTTVVSQTYQRIGNTDRNDLSDWAALPRSSATNNASLSAPFVTPSTLPFTATPLADFVNGVVTGQVMFAEPARTVRLVAIASNAPAATSTPFEIGAADDLSLSINAPGSAFVLQPFAAEFLITNSGPSDATAIWFTNRYSAPVTFGSVITSQGNCFVSNGVLICELGPLAQAEAAAISVTLTTATRGLLTNEASLTRAGEPDGFLPNNRVVQTTSIGFPQMFVLDATNTEPNTGTSPLNFTVRLTSTSSLPVSVSYAVTAGTAQAGVDFQPVSGVLQIPPGASNGLISVPIIGDLLSEPNETVLLTLSSPANVELVRAAAVGTIADNDAGPQLFISDATVVEGDDGTTNAIFSVTISAISGKTVNIGFYTVNVTALAGLDYEEAYGLLLFPPGLTNQTIIVPVRGDRVPEATKTFQVQLSNPGNASLGRALGVGTILDDDLALLDRFSFDAVPQDIRHAGTQLPVVLTARDSSGAPAVNFLEPVRLLAVESPRTNTIATTNATWELPFGTAFHDTRLQSLYLSNEVGAAGRIIALELDVAAVPPHSLNQWTIRLRHHPNPILFTPVWETQGWITNFQHDVTLSSTGWVRFPFSTPFDYNGRDQLMVDFSFDNSSFSTDGLIRSSPTAFNRSTAARSDSAFGNPLGWSGFTPLGTLSGQVPNLRLVTTREIPVSPTHAIGFVNGVWSGLVTVASGGTNLSLRAVDATGHTGESAPMTLLLLRATVETATGGGVRIRFATIGSLQYLVERSESPTGPWAPASTPLLGNGAMLEFTELPLASPQFYRVRLLP